jgi:signal transduction histidine kinase
MALKTQAENMHKQSTRLLIVDDDFSIRLLLSRTLEDHYQVTTAENGREALDLLEQDQFDLVLSDVRMPEVDGFGVLSAMRENPAYNHIPVILISALADNADIILGLEMGANDYITKPIDRRLALARIRTQLMLKEALDQHEQTISELKSIQAMRDRFFHIASHDLKNPMNNIRMAHFLMRSVVDDDPSSDVLLDNIEMALDTMEGIVSDFLDMAAIQSRALDLDFRAVSIEDALWEVIIQYNISAQKKDIVVKITDGSGVIRADFRRLVQALSNLVSNAIKYSPRGSEVTLFTHQTAEAARIFIRDQGPGIPAEERDMLFSEFGKLSTTPTEGEGRTGLGLWIVKQLVALQGGTVGAEFPDDGGSVFWVELPIWTQPVVEALHQAS